MTLPKSYRHWRRYRQVIETILRQGFGYVLDQVELTPTPALPLTKIIRARWKRQALSRAVRLRLICEELGSTFIKLGQVISVRRDLFPEDIVTEMARLQDNAPELPFAVIRTVVEEELSCRLEDKFSQFDVRPLAAASIAQVHRAQLFDGTVVAVKVQRPGIVSAIKTDLEILTYLAEVVKERIPSLPFDSTEVIGEFARDLRRELDFRNEAYQYSRFKRLLQENSHVIVPEVQWELTTSRVLTSQYIEGVKIDDVSKLKAWGLEPKEIAEIGAKAFLEQVMFHGVFHGDPHPGNLLVTPSGRLALLDLGTVGTLNEETMLQLAELFLAVVQRRPRSIVRQLKRLGFVGDGFEHSCFLADLTAIMDRYYGLPLSELRLGVVLNDILDVIYRHKIRLPSNLSLLVKVLLMVEGIGEKLDPDFNVAAFAKPFAKTLIKRKYSADQIVHRGVERAQDYVDVIGQLPYQINQALTVWNRGQARLLVENVGLSAVLKYVGIVANRISFAMVVSALLLVSAVIIYSGRGPVWHGMPVVGLISLMLAICGVLALLISILHSRHW